MEPTTEVPTSGRRNFVIATVVVLVVAISIAGYFIIKKVEVPVPVEAEKQAVTIEKSIVQIEKERILAELAQGSPGGATTQVEKERIIKNLSKSSLTSEASNNERMRILQALASSTTK